MSVFKCKMCGGDLTVSDGSLVAVCDYCGSSQTVPSGNDEKKINLFNRANRLRMNSEFDKAGTIYEQIIAEFPEEAEAYWCLCLCNYGIEYVDDPATANKVPTVHRASFEKMRKDENYELACEYADTSVRIMYQEEAKKIDRIMSDILAISANEKPYDIFICYKETDNYGGRTPDSVIAQDIYDTLTDKGYKVFFSRITLEDKLGLQYEPYIFAALNSAKIMLAIGTDYEYYNAVWVKNEWSRFLKLATKDKSKVLIPCFKDLDAYDMPDEFKGLQAQDMGKLGWMQDLLRGIDKLFGKNSEPANIQSVPAPVQANATVESLLKRGFMFLEDGDFESADHYAEKVLDIDPEEAKAYLIKFLSQKSVKSVKSIRVLRPDDDRNPNYVKFLKFSKDSENEEIHEIVSKAVETGKAAYAEANNFESLYSALAKKIKTSPPFTEEKCLYFAERFEQFKGYEKSYEIAESLREKAEDIKNNHGTVEVLIKSNISEDSFGFFINDYFYHYKNPEKNTLISVNISGGKYSFRAGTSAGYSTKPIEFILNNNESVCFEVKSTLLSYSVNKR